MRRATHTLAGCLAVAGACAVVVPAALAQRAYVANSGSGSVTVFDTATNTPLGAIVVGAGPTDVAITPDGTRAYVANAAADTLAAIDTATNAVIATIPVGGEPKGLAISPDGARVYVANAAADTVSVVSTTANTVLGPPISVGDQPEGIAVAPDGARTFIAQRGGGIAVIETATASVIGTIPDALGPAKLALTPDGGRGFAANASSNSVTIFNLGSGAVLGSPVLAGANPAGIVLAPRGIAYVSSGSDNTVVALDPATRTAIGPPIAGFAGPAGIAASADGATAYVANSGASSVSVLDAASLSVRGTIPTGAAPQALAIVPDQPPRAIFSAERAQKRGQLIRFDASASTDSDGRVASYTWSFGDGQAETGPSPLVEHTYASPGSYLVTLTASDEQGCSTTMVFTGQTASCNGSAVASFSGQVKALDTIRPAFRLGGARQQFLGPRVILRARCPKERCKVSIGAFLAASAKNAGGPRAARIALPPVKVSIPSGGKATVKLPLPRKAVAAARRSLAAGGTAGLRISAVARDVAANKATRKLQLRLLLPQRRGNK